MTRPILKFPTPSEMPTQNEGPVLKIRFEIIEEGDTFFLVGSDGRGVFSKKRMSHEDLDAETLAKMDTWRSKQPDKPSREMAHRMAMKKLQKLHS